MKKTLLFAFCILLLSSGFAQVDTTDFGRLKKEYDDFIKNEKESFRKFKEARDEEFAEFLKKDWENYKLFVDNKPIVIPGPEIVPVFDVKKIDLPEKLIPASNIKAIPQIILPEIELQLRPIPKPEAPGPRKDYSLTGFNMYGKEIKMIYPKGFEKLKVSKVSETNIADFWEKASETDYYRVIDQLLDYQNTMYLNDFAYLKLVENFSASVKTTENEQKLLSWFLLAKSGYKIKVGYFNEKIHLMIPVVNTVYSFPYFIFDNLKFYVFDNSGEIKNIYTYKDDYPEANRIMNFNIYKAPIFSDETLSRTLKFNYKSESYSFDINYNKSLIDFYADFPQSEIQVFFNAGISNAAKESLDMNLEKILVEMSELEAAGFLLNMVQNAFEYKTDGDQFGYERFFFSEEIFHYDYSDCEDRSVFYAYLISEYLRLPVVGLNYPGHIATAVKFSENPGGYSYLINNEKFTVCDPTYINAPVGACMPEYVNSSVSIINLNNKQALNNEEELIWGTLAKNGYLRANHKNDIIKIAENEWFVTGVFYNPLNTASSSKLEKETLFVAKTDNAGNIISVNKILSGGAIMPLGIESGNNAVVLSAYFEKNLTYNNTSIENTGEKELFIAKFDIDNKLISLLNTGLIQEDITKTVFFAISLDKDLKLVDKSSISEQSFEQQRPVEISSEGIVRIVGKFDGMEQGLVSSEVYASKSSYDYLNVFKEMTASYIAKNYDKDAASVFAFMSILQNGDIKIIGKELLAVANTMNSNFEKSYPILYNALSEIESVESRNGIITINTKLGELMISGGILIDKTARIRIRNYKSGNVEIIVLSGFYYKPYIKSYEINYFKLFKHTGDIIIDYDIDNDQKLINVKKNLLK